MGVSRVPSEHYLPGDRWLHQELLQILVKYMDRPILRHRRQLISDFPLNGRTDQPLVGILHGRLDGRLRIVISPTDQRAAHRIKNLVGINVNFHRQEILLLAAIDREDAVAGDL